MEIICLLLCTLSLTAARVHPRTGVNDDLNGVEGVMYDIPEYEDPEVNLFKLIARGLMPVYTVRDDVKDSKDSSNKNGTLHYQTDISKNGTLHYQTDISKNGTQHYQTDISKNGTQHYQTDISKNGTLHYQTDITKILDTVIIQLQEAKNKLESGKNASYFDIDKSVLSLENLKQRLYVDLRSASTERPLMDNVSTERPLMDNVSTGLLPVNDASTEQPFVLHEAAYAYIPVAEFSSDEEEVKTDTGIDDVSSADADKVEQGDKTLIRKKWSYKLSSLS